MKYLTLRFFVKCILSLLTVKDKILCSFLEETYNRFLFFIIKSKQNKIIF